MWFKKILEPKNQYYLLCLPYGHSLVYIYVIFLLKNIGDKNIKRIRKVMILFGASAIFYFFLIEVMAGFFQKYSNSITLIGIHSFCVLWGVILIKLQER